MTKLIQWENIHDINRLIIGKKVRVADKYSRQETDRGIVNAVGNSAFVIEIPNNLGPRIKHRIAFSPHVIVQQGIELQGVWKEHDPSQLVNGCMIKSFGRFPFYSHTSYAVVSNVKQSGKIITCDLWIDHLDVYSNYILHDHEKVEVWHSSFTSFNPTLKFDDPINSHDIKEIKVKPDNNYPHNCPHCNGPAYISFTDQVDCMNKCKESLQ